jgi:lysophospholipase L1-like esterase
VRTSMLDKSWTFALTWMLSLACSEADVSPPGGTAQAVGGVAEPGGVASGGMDTGIALGGTGSVGTDRETSNPMLGGIGAAAGGSGTAAGGSDNAGGDAGGSDGGAAGGLEWLPSWATTIQRTEPNNLPPPLANTTLRQFVWPTVSGREIRIQLSNEKGTTPVDILQVHIAMALTQDNPANSGGQIDTSTDAAFTFNGVENVTIPAGQTVWSDALDFPLQEIRLTAVSMQFGGAVPVEITGHPGARTTSYVVNGDAVAQQGLAGAQTRDRWYFINAIEVMAPSDAYAIALLGDSITDGYGVLNQFSRWCDYMTLAIQNDARIADNRSVLNFGMGANNLTSSNTNQDAGVIRFERDVLTRDKIKWLVVFEGINDIIGGVQAQPIIDAYRQIIQKAHEKGILVYGSPITPNGPSAVRTAVNDWVRTSGEFDQVIDFDATIRDPNNVDAILPMYNNDGLHPSIAGYEAMGNSVDLSLFYEPASN